jgi:hypothetical protein
MNIHIHHVISDITGLTVLAIVDAILSGERGVAKWGASEHSGGYASVRTSERKSRVRFVRRFLLGPEGAGK